MKLTRKQTGWVLIVLAILVVLYLPAPYPLLLGLLLGGGGYYLIIIHNKPRKR